MSITRFFRNGLLATALAMETLCAQTENLATKNVEITSALTSSKVVFLGRIVDMGLLALSGTGRNSYDEIIVEILSPIKDRPPVWRVPVTSSPLAEDTVPDWHVKIPPPWNGHPAVLTKCALSIPGKYRTEAEKEEPPVAGENYIVAGSVEGEKLVILKLLPATPEHLKSAQHILDISPIDTTRLDGNQKGGSLTPNAPKNQGSVPNPPMETHPDRSVLLLISMAIALLAFFLIIIKLKKK